jgi:hypothetical protein
MTLPEPKACTACALHIVFHGQHLCTLPVEAFGLTVDSGEYIAPFEDELDELGEWIGTDCDKVRRMGEICGPSGKLWEPAQA